MLLVSVLIAAAAGSALWWVVLNVGGTGDWQKMMTGTELGLQAGVLVAMGGFAAPLGWVDCFSPRRMSKYILVFLIGGLGVLSVCPFLVWAALHVTPLEMLQMTNPGISSHAEIKLSFFVALISQIWLSIGGGLIGQAVLGYYAGVPSAALTFLALVGLQDFHLLRFFPGGYYPRVPELNWIEFLVSGSILVVGIALSVPSRLGARPIGSRFALRLRRSVAIFIGLT